MQKVAERKLTPEQAKTFQKGERESSFILLLAARQQRAKAGIHPDCQCLPYEDWFTFNRWLAQGLAVKRGEHGEKLPVLIEQEEKTDDGEARVRTRPWTSVVFCRCQVERKERGIRRMENGE